MAGEGRAEPQTCTAVSRVPLCTLHTLCIHPIPSLLLGRHARGCEGQSPCSHARAVLHPHWDHLGQEEFLGSQVFIPALGKGGKQGTEGGARGTRDKPPMTAPVQAGDCQLSMLTPVIRPFPEAINK